MIFLQRPFLPPALFLILFTLAATAEIRPGAPLDYQRFAFYPKRWAEKKVSTMMVPWKGEQIVLLASPDAKLDPAVMRSLIAKLDGGWELYAELTGRRPAPHRTIEGLAPIAALPRGDLSCGVGCGYVGSTGIEIGKFYRADYPALRKQPDAVPHYLFYEMGRNFFTFGHRHSLFTTGYAVFMRYVCMDSLNCRDDDIRTRRIIESAEAIYAASELSFLASFTNFVGQGEKGHRLKQANGRPLVPSDQPVMYATAMLKLWKENGGNAWLKSFYRHLAQCPPVKPVDRDAALRQAMNWYVAASCAAQHDLSEVFVDRWRFPMDAETRTQCAAIDWKAPGLDARAIAEQLTEP